MSTSAFLFAFLAVLSASGLQDKTQASRLSPGPFIGEWKANLAKSRLTPNYPLKAATLQFEIAGDQVTITYFRLYDVDGVTEIARIQADGEEHPIERNGVVRTTRWISAMVFEIETKRSGKDTQVRTYEASLDGKTVTLTTSFPDAEQVIVFERQ